MELLEHTVTDELFRKIALERDSKSIDFTNTAKLIQNQCLEKIDELEVEAGLRDPTVDTKKRRAQPFWPGLGQRVINYKKATKKKSLTGPSTTSLVQQVTSPIRTIAAAVNNAFTGGAARPNNDEETNNVQHI